ncbi:hypothetical protein GYMLUDRAFT_616948 [Collybiopsis luxurians FD-317 M1]|uniref:Mediator of RNA polymerase II transcription subunit 13 n=1 Tax=Collybiopsis luxurians FD-317 M1 TaxID=944289 RepID=A0A0D0BWM2_9AGAR|nr:hypothetical protein GYMLUDRAFT_616948 [Collybiopsis luxurians FD-317 M1]
MTLGKSSFCEEDGIVSFQFDSSFRKNLDLSSPKGSFVFFVLIPLSAMTFASETLRHIFSAVKKASKTHPDDQILFQFVPEPHVLNAAVHPSSPLDYCSESFLESVYNRILLPVDRATSRKLLPPSSRVKKFFEVPAFTLARPLSESKVTYSCSINPSLDVLDHYTLLHVGYQVSSCGRWILAACIDQRGEAHDIGVWSTQPYVSTDKKDDESTIDGGVVPDEMYVVSKVWDFAMQFAEKGNVEWRLAFAKLGTMGTIELDAWMTHLSTVLYSISRNAQTPVHASLLSVERSAPWVLLPAQLQSPTLPSQSSNPPSKGPSLSRSVSGSIKTSSKSQFFIDTSMTTYSLYQKTPTPVGPPPTLQDLGLATDLLANTVAPIESDDHPVAHNQPLLPLSSSALVRTPSSSNSHSPTLPQMTQIHLLYTAKSEGCTYPPVTSGVADSPHSLLHDITNSFYSLSVLSNARWSMAGGKSLLPFHLGAVETMSL